ncbi:RNA-directed DNA polymerase, eukaryota, reverse transcriptase zinc-binding domain protein [Tanacetum coccineum]
MGKSFEIGRSSAWTSGYGFKLSSGLQFGLSLGKIRTHQCLRSSRGSVLVNGSTTEEFQFYKGLKQGDPLSPFLFILVMESLHLSFKRVEDAGMFNGIKINSSMTLSHMFYADDAIFMGQWSKRNIDTLMYMLKCFERASGLSINLSKSKLMGLAVSIEKVEEVTRHIGCGILNTPFSFLGSKVGGCMSRIKSWDEVIDKMVNRLSKWKMKTLSIGGRLTLLKAVFGSMPIYHMSIFKVPMLVLQRMESIRCHFFNGNDLDSKRSIWVSWNKVLTSKEKGGLGVSSLFALNRALMFKWVWRFFNQSDSLWVRVIHAIHGVDGRIGRAGNVGYTSIWCDIIKEMDRLASHGIDLISMMHKKIGNGSNTSFWKDRWRGEQRLKEVFPRIYALEVNKHISVAFKFEQTSLSSSLRRMPRSGIESEQWDHLLDSLEGVMLSPSEDRWSWDLNGSGEFSVASARRYIDNNRLPDISSKTRWIKEVPIKVNVHAWKVRINGLPTRWNISRRGIDIPSILCPLCETGVESSKHLFFNCSVVRAIFRRVCIWWDVSYMELDSFDEWISWITNLRLPSKHKRLLEGVCYGLWWFIWAFRNKKIFGVVPSSKANIFDDLVLSRRSRKECGLLCIEGHKLLSLLLRYKSESMDRIGGGILFGPGKRLRSKPLLSVSMLPVRIVVELKCLKSLRKDNLRRYAMTICVLSRPCHKRSIQKLHYLAGADPASRGYANVEMMNRVHFKMVHGSSVMSPSELSHIISTPPTHYRKGFLYLSIYYPDVVDVKKYNTLVGSSCTAESLAQESRMLITRLCSPFFLQGLASAFSNFRYEFCIVFDVGAFLIVILFTQPRAYTTCDISAEESSGGISMVAGINVLLDFTCGGEKEIQSEVSFELGSGGGLMQAGVVAGAEVVGGLVATSVVNGILGPGSIDVRNPSVEATPASLPRSQDNYCARIFVNGTSKKKTES